MRGQEVSTGFERLAEVLGDRNRIDLSKVFIDATSVSERKEALRSVQRVAARAPRSWVIVDGHGLPLAVASASPREPHLLPATFNACFLPDRLIGG